MRRRERVIYGGAVLLSLGAHFGLLQGLGAAAAIVPRQRQRVVELAVLEPPPPAPKPEPPPPPKPRPAPIVPPVVDLPPPPNTSDAVEPAEEAKPVFGVSLSSVVGPGTDTSFRVRVGNTLMKDPEAELTPPAEVRPYAPVPLHQVTRAPRFAGGQPCKPPYPAEARRLGVEGRVELEVELRADGTVGEIRLVKGLGHGLDEAAIAALRDCPFEPAEAHGRAVTTRVPVGILFVIEE